MLKSEDCPFGIDRLFHEFPLSMRPVQKVVGQTVVVRVSGFLFQVFVSGFGFKKSWFYPSCFLFQVFCFKFLVSGFGLKSCGSNYRGSCFVFQVSSFGFRFKKSWFNKSWFGFHTCSVSTKSLNTFLCKSKSKFGETETRTI